ncbi:dTDP-4-dehydrorhamnose 3,5-epimerase [candidate division KSB1 bacterium]|nr:dTDP-4-dehydrorhamnose 3,5-epimerase [candidate division KSB1 bacterium]
MQFLSTEIKDVVLIKPDIFTDQRGYFLEMYNQKEYKEHGINAEFVQDNMSSSVKGTLRGLHYQIEPHAQGKLVQVTRGKVFDVAVDLRKKSPTFGKWVGVELSEDNKYGLYIPPGFAHGFYVLSKVAEFFYKCTAFYAPLAERGVIWNDPSINIKWPILNKNILLSEKDRHLPVLDKADINF